MCIRDRIDVIHGSRLHTGGERCHLSLFTFVPDDTLHKTLGVGADREEVNGGGRGLKLHGVGCLCAYYRAGWGRVRVRVDSPSTGIKTLNDRKIGDDLHFTIKFISTTFNIAPRWTHNRQIFFLYWRLFSFRPRIISSFP